VLHHDAIVGFPIATDSRVSANQARWSGRGPRTIRIMLSGAFPHPYGSVSLVPCNESGRGDACHLCDGDDGANVVPAITTCLNSLSGSAASTTTASASATPSIQACRSSLNGAPPSPTPPGWNSSGKVRQYYIAAEEVEWDYAPTGWDNWLGVGVPHAYY